MSDQIGPSGEAPVRGGFAREDDKTVWQKFIAHPAILLILGLLLFGLVSTIASESYRAVMPVQTANKFPP